jgi:hypothetical protein
MAYLPPGVAPCKEGSPAGGAENCWSQVVGGEGAVLYLPPGVASREEGSPAGGAENSWSQVVGMRWLTYRLA